MMEFFYAARHLVPGAQSGGKNSNIPFIGKVNFQGEILSIRRRKRSVYRLFLISSNLLSRVAISSFMALMSSANLAFSL